MSKLPILFLLFVNIGLLVTSSVFLGLDAKIVTEMGPWGHLGISINCLIIFVSLIDLWTIIRTIQYLDLEFDDEYVDYYGMLRIFFEIFVWSIIALCSLVLFGHYRYSYPMLFYIYPILIVHILFVLIFGCTIQMIFHLCKIDCCAILSDHFDQIRLSRQRSAKVADDNIKVRKDRILEKHAEIQSLEVALAGQEAQKQALIQQLNIQVKLCHDIESHKQEVTNGSLQIIIEQVPYKAQCPICYEREANYAIVSCGHKMCVQCKDQIKEVMKDGFTVKECHICRKTICQIIKVFDN
jgi:hypothetical protein